MASAPQPQLPLFYKDLLPLNSRDHSDWAVAPFDDASFVAETHAIPLTVDEFVDAQRNYPIVFTANDTPLPIALMGLNEGVNTFIDDKGKLEANVYVPAYIRRYPFILAKLQADSEDMSLCFDPKAGVVAKDNGGQALFEADGDEKKATQFTTDVLEFCRKLEESGQRTKAFLDQLNSLDLMMDGEIGITRADMPDKPFVYRGFKMVDEKKLRELPTEKVEELNKSGMLMLIHAHLFSMNLMRNVFERQTAQGKVPLPAAAS